MDCLLCNQLKCICNLIIQIRPYAEKLHDILVNLVAHLGSVDFENIFAEHKETKRILIVAITSNRGLCGGFNSNVIKKVEELLYTTYSSYYQKGTVDIIAIGKKGADGLKAKKIRVKNTLRPRSETMIGRCRYWP